MLENYFENTSKSEEEAKKKLQRLLAVQAALEIAKASASSAAGANGSMYTDLRDATSQINILADAIQEALKV